MTTRPKNAKTPGANRGRVVDSLDGISILLGAVFLVGFVGYAVFRAVEGDADTLVLTGLVAGAIGVVCVLGSLFGE